VLAALSPVRGCGKTKLLMILEKLAADPQRHGNISAASIYRLVEQHGRTVLLDEGDNLNLKFDRVMRGVLNDGYLTGGTTTRIIHGEPKSFSVFAPLAIAAIGTLTLPLLQRSIVISMHRSTRTDMKTIEALGLPEEVARLEALHRLIVAWAQHAEFDLHPPLPKILRGRAEDNWRVLCSIADSFGSKYWSEAAREAAIAFAGGWHDEDAPVMALYDIHAVFHRNNIDRIKSAALTEALNVMEDGVGIWSAWRGENDDHSPHPITQGELATLLRKFNRDLRPRPLFELGSRETRGKAGRGYYKEQFAVWWAKYCPDLEGDDGEDNVRQLRPGPAAE
jgi:hypothetical protein